MQNIKKLEGGGPFGDIEKFLKNVPDSYSG